MAGRKRKSNANLWQNSATGRWHWDFTKTRKDGTVYRKTGNRKDRALAIRDRDEAIAAFDNFEGRAGSWTVMSWGQYVAESVWPNELAETTANAYSYSLKNHVVPKIGAVRLDALTVSVLQDWANLLQATVGRTVTNNSLTALGSVLTRAVEHGLIQSNPARNVKLRKSPTSDEASESKMILSSAQQTRLVEASKGTCMELPILLGLRLGLRMGECLGLRWSDVDLDEKVLQVRQQLVYVSGNGDKLTPPKSKQGRRSLPIPESMVPILSSAKRATASIYVCTRDGKLIGSKKASHYFRYVAKAAGFRTDEGIPTHHDCRSTFLTHLANFANEGKGVKPHVLMAIAGHSSLSTTMKYYIRASDEDLRKTMACIG